jgi:hypothetical protein
MPDKSNPAASGDTFYSPTVRAYGPLPDDHPFYALVGRVAAEAARLDHILDVIIWELSGTNSVRASCVTAQITSSAGRCQAIAALATVQGLSLATVEDAISLKERLSGLLPKRNRIIHDAWFHEGSSTTGSTGQFVSYTVKKAGRRGRYGIEPVTKEEIDAVIRQLAAEAGRATKLRGKVREQLKPS